MKCDALPQPLRIISRPRSRRRSRLYLGDGHEDDFRRIQLNLFVASANGEEQPIPSAAVPAMQRIGYAVGAALAGIIANASGFSEGLNRDAAASV